MTHMLRDVVRDVVERAAPEELPLLQALEPYDDARAARLLRHRDREALSFGLTDLVALVTPVVWLALYEAYRGATDTVFAVLRESVANGVRRLLRREARVSVGALDDDQRRLVHGRVVHHAMKAGMDEDAAHALANAVLTSELLERATTGEETPRAVAQGDGDGSSGGSRL